MKQKRDNHNFKIGTGVKNKFSKNVIIVLICVVLIYFLNFKF